MREIKAVITLSKTKITTKLTLDGELYEECSNYIDSHHADGYFADVFHYLTMNRYSTPREPLPFKTVKIVKQRELTP